MIRKLWVRVSRLVGGVKPTQNDTKFYVEIVKGEFSLRIGLEIEDHRDNNGLLAFPFALFRSNLRLLAGLSDLMLELRYLLIV